MPKQKKIAYKKCHQCRKDRQKCLPEDRVWPGRKCERCEHYGYVCSAMRTKHDESSATSGPGTGSSPGLQNTPASMSPPSTSPQARRSEERCLQDLGDLRQLFKLFQDSLLDNNFVSDRITRTAVMLDEALSTVVQEIIVWARQHEADRRYRDAEYLFRRTFHDAEISMRSMGSMSPRQNEDVLHAPVSIYEKMGDYPAAEMAQEMLLRQLVSDNGRQSTGEQIRAVCCTYARLLSKFQTRILDLTFNLPDLHYYRTSIKENIDLCIVYRVAALDNILLNQVSLEQGLITLKPNEDAYCTALHIAAKENAINFARLLIEMGADVDSRDRCFRTPLHIAAEFANPAMIELLLAKGAEIQVKDTYSGATPLHAALTRNPDEQTLALLINAKADLEARDMHGKTALGTAISKGLPVAAKFLLQHGANADVSGSLLHEKLLLIAMRTEKEWAIKLLLENGANLRERNAQGDTALSIAVIEGQEPIIQILLDYGAMTKTTVDEQNPLDDTVLHCAVRAANIAIVKMLLKAGADIYRRDYYGNTALDGAIRDEQEHMVRLLLEHSAPLAAVIDFGQTALQGAIRRGQEHMVRLLLEHSAPLDRVNDFGETALHSAVCFRRRNMIPVIVAHIKPDKLPIMCRMRNSFNETPLDVARRLAKDAKEYSDERSVLYLLESALKLSHSFTKSIT